MRLESEFMRYMRNLHKKNKHLKTNRKARERHFFILIIILLLGIFAVVANITLRQELRKKAATNDVKLSLSSSLATPTPSDNSCLPSTLTEAFNGNPNTAYWEEWKNNSGFIEIKDGVLKASTPSEGYAGIITRGKTCGDFDTQVDFSAFTASPQSEANARLSVINESTNSEMFIQYYKKDNSQGFWTDLILNNTPTSGKDFSSSVTSGKLRIKREGNIFSSYYDAGSGWTLLGTYSNGFDAASQIGIVVKSFDKNPSVSANFDNFSYEFVNSSPTSTTTPNPSLTPTVSPTPTGSNVTPSPTGAVTPILSLTPTGIESTPTATPISTPSATPISTPSATIIPSPTLFPTQAPKLPKTAPVPFPPGPYCPSILGCPKKEIGDANCDGFIDKADYKILLEQFDTMVSPDPANLNANFSCREDQPNTYFVDLVDFEIWRRYAGSIPGGISPVLLSK